MKLKFSKIILPFFLLSLLSSCSLKTYRSEKLFLYSTFTLNHAYEYKSDFMNIHSFIPIRDGVVMDSLFEKNKNVIKFYPLYEDKNPVFDLDFTLKGQQTVENRSIEYSLKTSKEGEMVIELQDELEKIVSKEIYVFPNYWLRIHFETIVDDISYNLILEYKNSGKTVIPE